jgi:hypothetical protein
MQEEAYLFIVRLWSAERSRTDFRAAVQRAGTDESEWFTQADAPVRHFEWWAGVPPRSRQAPPDRSKGLIQASGSS